MFKDVFFSAETGVWEGSGDTSGSPDCPWRGYRGVTPPNRGCSLAGNLHVHTHLGFVIF